MFNNSCQINAANSRVGAGVLLVQRLAEFGVSADSFLASQGLDRGLFEDPDNRISFGRSVQLYSSAAEATGCEGIAALAGISAGFEQLGLLGALMREQVTVISALKVAEKAFALQATGAKIKVCTLNDALEIHYFITDNTILSSGHISSGVLSYICSIMKAMCGPRCRPVHTSIPLKVPSDKGPFVEAFGTRIVFNATHGILRFEPRWINEAPLTEKTCSIGSDREVKYNDGLLDSINAICSEAAMNGFIPKMSEVSIVLGVSERTLSRHLSDLGTTYRDIRQESAFTAAIRIMIDTQMSVTDIAFSLGYSEVAAFTRAFNHWAGFPPSEVRQRLLGKNLQRHRDRSLARPCLGY